MMKKLYALFNRSNRRYLEHPNLGIYLYETREEAEQVFDSCIKYLNAYSLFKLSDQIEIKEIDIDFI